MTPDNAIEFKMEKKDWVSGRTLGLVIFAGFLVVAMSLHSRSFLTEVTFFSQSRYVAFYILIALSQAICLASGGMNLTVGAVGSIVTVILGLCLDSWGLPLYLGVPIAFAVGPLTGLLHGLIITRLKIDCFIVTLSMMFIYMGLRSGISGGGSYVIPESFWWIGQGSIGMVSYMFIFVMIILAGTAFMLSRTVLGRRLLATGSNPDAARLSGINTDRMVIMAHMLSGGFAALAAILWASWSGNAAPQTGDDWMIISFAVAIIGGTGLSGGVISGVGIFMGAIIFKMIQHSLVIMKINDSYSNTVLGALILLAIVIDRTRERFDKKDS